MRISANPETRNDSIAGSTHPKHAQRPGPKPAARSRTCVRKNWKTLGLSGALKNLVADAARRANCARHFNHFRKLPALSTKTEQCMLRNRAGGAGEHCKARERKQHRLKLVQSQKS
jgi:hypothetical protein